MASHDSETTRHAEQSFRAIEGISDYQWPYPLLGNVPEFDGDTWSGYYGAAFVYPPYFYDTQKRGEALPYYLTERQLKVIRDRSRRLVAENEFALSAVENRISYIVGSGFNYRILPIHEDVDDELVKTTQRVVDIFVEANRLWEVEQETVRRVDRDGEAFLRIFFSESGLLQMRPIEPELVRSPDGDSDPTNSFGIKTNPRDIQDIKGYWVVESPLAGSTPTLVPASEVIHVKANLDSSSKRGLPLLYPVEANLRRAEELLVAMTMTAKVRSKISLIRRIEGTSKSKAESMKASLETGQAFDPTTGGITNVEQLRPGSVITSSKNMEYEFPDQGNYTSGIEVLKAELRAVAARLVMPEPMLTADASGGTYSSFLVSEAPATRNFQRLQRFYRGIFGESRAKHHEALVWRQIAYAVQIGLLPEDALTKLKVIAHPPEIISRDPDKSAAAYKTYMDMGVISPQYVAGQIGTNYDQMMRERKEAGLPDLAQMNAMMSGMPGDQGMTAPNAGSAPNGDPNAEHDEGPGDVGSDGTYDFDSSVFE